MNKASIEIDRLKGEMIRITALMLNMMDGVPGYGYHARLEYGISVNMPRPWKGLLLSEFNEDTDGLYAQETRDCIQKIINEFADEAVFQLLLESALKNLKRRFDFEAKSCDEMAGPEADGVTRYSFESRQEVHGR